MKTKDTQSYLAELLGSDESRVKLKAIYDDVLLEKEIGGTWIDCPRCGSMKRVEVKTKKYDLQKEVLPFLRFAADFGIGKPADRKAEVSPPANVEDLSTLTDEQLAALLR